MADPLSSLASGGIKGIGDAISEVISQFHMSPEQKAQVQAVIDANQEKIAELNQQVQIKQIDADTQQDSTAGDNIRMELQSPDGAVRRAPVAPIWMGCAVLIWNFMFLPFLHIWCAGAVPVNLPAAFWYAWIFAMMGFTGGAALQRALGGQGGIVSLLGMKAESKGD